MKKVISLLLAVSIIMLSACGKGKTDASIDDVEDKIITSCNLVINSSTFSQERQWRDVYDSYELVSSEDHVINVRSWSTTYKDGDNTVSIFFWILELDAPLKELSVGDEIDFEINNGEKDLMFGLPVSEASAANNQYVLFLSERCTTPEGEVLWSNTKPQFELDVSKNIYKAFKAIK